MKSESLYELGQNLRCPMCHGSEFSVGDVDVELRITDDTVTEICDVNLNSRANVTCSDCEWTGKLFLCNSALQNGMTHDAFMAQLTKTHSHSPCSKLAELATTLWGVNVVFQENEAGGDGKYVIVPKPKKGK